MLKFFFSSFKLTIKNCLFFIKGARVKTLSAILTPVAMSSAWAFHITGTLKKDILFFTVCSALFIQIAVNFFNDALDSKEGAYSDRKGPERLVQSGKMSFSKVQAFAFLSCLLALLFGIPLIFRGGLIIFALGIVSLILSYLYTGSSFSLLKMGLSESFCFLFFGLMAVTGTYYLQTLQFNSHLIYLGIQCGLWAMSLLLINHLRDEKEDLAKKRKHFVTLYGRQNTLLFLVISQAFIYLLCFFWLGQGLNSGAFSFFVLPFSVALIYFICVNPPSKKYNLYLALYSLNYILFGGAWIMGLVWL